MQQIVRDFETEGVVLRRDADRGGGGEGRHRDRGKEMINIYLNRMITR